MFCSTLEFGGDSPATWRGRQSVAGGSPAIIFRSLILDKIYVNQIRILVVFRWVTCLYMNNEAVNLIVSISGDDKYIQHFYSL